ncbi:MAG: lipoate--protein ligase family protein [Candidatus Bathyarchaeota archaeon]|nr:MAG: lipoate--protein ligase family protein [Candidatus Bathyarchaeota archaeon]
MGAWRLLKLETRNAFMNMAFDEAVFKARIAGMVPNTLRFYRWKPSAVSIGRFQRAPEEVHVENCRRLGVDIVRRITGGGAVYHDYEGEITYSVVVSEKDVGSRNVISAYNMICRGLIEAAKILGVRADFNPGDPEQCPNITIDRRKFSGSAQLHRKGVLLQHGTFLVQTDLKKMFTFLNVPWARSLEDVLRVAEKKLTSIEGELQSSISNEEAHEALIRGFQKALNTELVKGDITDHEEGLAEELCKEKYAGDAWNFRGDNSR